MSLLNVVLDSATNYERYQTKNQVKTAKAKKQKNNKTKPVNNEVTDNNENKIINTSVSKESSVSDNTDSSPQLVIPEMTSENLLQGVLWSEILGKPVSKRRGRW